VAQPGTPTLRRRRLGSQLRALRESAGLTIEGAADRLDFSMSKISRIETGHIGANAQAVAGMLTLYQAAPDKVDEVTHMARQAKQKDWWHLYGSALTTTFIEAEAEASRILGYEAQVMPGLLQIEPYARRIIRAARPDITDEQLDRRIEIRTRRQQRLVDDRPLDYHVILDEAVFARPVDDASVMRAQMDRLIEMADRPNVTVQILPVSVGVHAAMDGTFAILEYDGHPGVVFAENAAGGLFLELKEHHDRYTSIFRHLRAGALSPESSVAHLRDRRAAM
jgi:transcriptional regulator with XRE-family HTH domain